MMKKIDEAMSDAIKTRVKSGRSKSIILGGSGPMTGRTNAANPGSLNKLFEAYRDLTKADSILEQELPFEPVKRLPNIDQRFKDMGEAMGICPYELRDIMNANFDSDQTLIFTLLKKFISAVKLSGAVDLVPTHKMLKEVEANHRERHKNWRRDCANIRRRNQAITDEVFRKKAEFDKAWSEILIDLVTKVDRNSDINSLGDWDRLMVMAISITDENCCKIDKNTASLNFKACQKMDPSTVTSLPDVAHRIREQEEDIRWQSWLGQASTNELVKMLWQMGPGHDGEMQSHRREQLEWAIISKSGKRPVHDRWGNLDWHATFNNYEEYDEQDDYHINDLSQKEMVLKKLKTIRVTSGKGKKPKA